MSDYGATITIAVLLVFLLLFFAVGASLVAFSLGKLVERTHQIRRQSDIAALASIHALIGAEGLNKSTVIQRIVEKYNIIPKDADPSEAATKLEHDFQHAAGTATQSFSEEQRKKVKEALFGGAPIQAKDLI